MWIDSRAEVLNIQADMKTTRTITLPSFIFISPNRPMNTSARPNNDKYKIQEYMYSEEASLGKDKSRLDKHLVDIRHIQDEKNEEQACRINDTKGRGTKALSYKARNQEWR